jgi:hypothetical protein
MLERVGKRDLSTVEVIAPTPYARGYVFKEMYSG